MKKDIISEMVREKMRKIEEASKEKPRFSPGDKVMINAERMMKGDHYRSLSSGYRSFVESNIGRVFTARYDSGFITFDEDRTWLFSEDDLVSAEGKDV